ncbi:hypothetical protein F511_36092, partial [Dorcoceras hygrometricum]
YIYIYDLSGGEIEFQEIVNGLINTQIYNSQGISIVLIFISVRKNGVQAFPSPFSSMDS